MVQTYVDGFNRVGIMPNRELVNLMKSSARNGRRFRGLKKEYGPKMNDARKQMNKAQRNIEGLNKSIQVLDKEIKELKAGCKQETLEAKRKMCRTYLLTYDAACNLYTEQRAILQPMVETLKSEERMWMSTMRKLSYKQDALLTTGGLLNDDHGEPEWEDEQYELESVSLPAGDAGV